ncbi:TPA: HipA N-terminal domain-containing protein [Elizabethkingia anophelis]|nr:HipA N-terminal domain-containing protein [Elizabethkingia anophelis]HBN6707974.1 HipA N-terminal domain-containing protein [Elizabethkingia anophelis]HBN6712008.1 HipA N-terminal domain-containing protein [Elizabethkingia anophelis]HBN6715867.1 HipA N-terminal domain-containing protein [Elizabethkingia anophelis]HBN6720332.1 HipA N-terminal domain-containing protein [Elizabethkingia anophelis]
MAIRNGFIYFQYDKEFLQGNLEISSLKIPLQCGVIELQTDPFEGLAGIFNKHLNEKFYSGSLKSKKTPLQFRLQRSFILKYFLGYDSFTANSLVSQPLLLAVAIAYGVIQKSVKA